MHECIVLDKSEFFKTALKEDWKEGQDRVVRLPAAFAETFSSYVHWLYKDEVTVKQEIEDGLKETATMVSSSKSKFEAFIGLYGLAHFLGDIRLQNAVITSASHHADTHALGPAFKSVSMAYTETPEGSTMRRFLAAYYTTDISHKYYLENHTQFPSEFTLDMTLEFMRRRSNNLEPKIPRAANKILCDYHEHNDEVPRCTW